MLRDSFIFGLGLFSGVAALFALLRFPYWMHEHTRRQALKGRDETGSSRWLH